MREPRRLEMILSGAMWRRSQTTSAGQATQQVKPMACHRLPEQRASATMPPHTAASQRRRVSPAAGAAGECDPNRAHYQTVSGKRVTGCRSSGRVRRMDRWSIFTAAA